MESYYGVLCYSIDKGSIFNMFAKKHMGGKHVKLDIKRRNKRSPNRKGCDV